jgi:hypothetical protein
LANHRSLVRFNLYLNLLKPKSACRFLRQAAIRKYL